MVSSEAICELLLDSRVLPQGLPHAGLILGMSRSMSRRVVQSAIHNDAGRKSVPFSWALIGFAASIEVTY